MQFCITIIATKFYVPGSRCPERVEYERETVYLFLLKLCSVDKLQLDSQITRLTNYWPS